LLAVMVRRGESRVKQATLRLDAWKDHAARESLLVAARALTCKSPGDG